METRPFDCTIHVLGVDDQYGPGHLLRVGRELTVGRPWLSADGMTMYFHSRDITGGRGELDLWKSRRVRVGTNEVK